MFYFLVLCGKITIACITLALYIGFCTFCVLGFADLRQRWISKQLIHDEQNER